MTKGNLLKSIDTNEMVKEVAEALSEVKGKDIVILDLSEVTTFSDYFVIASAESNVQMVALADRVCKAISKKGYKSNKSEGRDSKSWILLDFGSIIVHIFSQAAREYYALENFWGDAKIIEWSHTQTMENLKVGSY